MGRVVTSGADAISAAAEGADLILLEVCRAVLHAKRHFAPSEFAHDDHEHSAFFQRITSCHSWALPASVATHWKGIINQASVQAMHTAGCMYSWIHSNTLPQ